VDRKRKADLKEAEGSIVAANLFAAFSGKKPIFTTEKVAKLAENYWYMREEYERRLKRKAYADKRASATKVVYFIQSKSTGEIKIGWTGGPVSDRVTMLQVGNPSELVLLATMPGGPNRERYVHNKFRDLKVRGEWYVPAPTLMEFIVKYAEAPE
jgi:hypothetical protein